MTLVHKSPFYRLKSIWLFSIFFIFHLLTLQTVTGKNIENPATENLQKNADLSTGKNSISAQIDLSLQRMTSNLEEALQLANIALSEAKTIGDKNLEIESLIVAGRIYTEQKEMERAITCFDSAMIIAEQIDDVWNKGEIHYRTGVVKFRKSEELQALESFNASIQACRLSDNFKTAGSSYSMMGTIFRINGLYDRAIEYIIKAKLNYQKADFKEGSAWTAYLLGRIYSDLKLHTTALGYFSEALEIYKHQFEIDGNKGGFAICYEQIGLLNIALGKFDIARENFDLMMQIYTDQNSKDGIANSNKNMGILEYSLGNYSEAEKLLSKAQIQKTELADFLSLPGIYEYLGLCMIKTGRTNEGFSHLKNGLDLAVNNNQKKIQLDIYSKMAVAYLNVNDLKNAMVCQNKQIEIQNVLLSGDANIKTEQLQAIYELDEKNKQIAELENQNKINELSIKQHRIIRNFMYVGVFLAFLISGIIYWFYNQLRHKNQQLLETNAAKDKLFAIIAHDLRGPTSALASLLEQLNSRFDEFSKTELKDLLSILFNSAENVSNLLENLLIWAQSQVNNIESRPTELVLNDVFQHVFNGLKQVTEDKQIDFRIEGDKSISVIADPDMLQIIMRNLLSNAIKFSHRGSSVLINAELNNKKTVRVSIIDKGVGIKKSQLETIFDISNKQNTQGTENEKSTGLGLILVKDFVEKNKGILTIESEPGKGTTVSFTLPLITSS